MSKQEKAFDKAVQQSVDFMYNHHRENMINGDPVDYLDNIIQHVDEQLNGNRIKKEFAITGSRNFQGFTDKLCDRILATQKPTKWDIAWREETDEGWEVKENPIYGYVVYYKLKKKLEQLIPEAEKIKLAIVFSREVFEPKSHSRKMIEGFLIRWIMNQDKTYPRAEAINALETTYPEISDMKTGEVINNWRDSFKEFYQKRTGKQLES